MQELRKGQIIEVRNPNAGTTTKVQIVNPDATLADGTPAVIVMPRSGNFDIWIAKSSIIRHCATWDDEEQEYLHEHSQDFDHGLGEIDAQDYSEITIRGIDYLGR